MVLMRVCLETLLLVLVQLLFAQELGRFTMVWTLAVRHYSFDHNHKKLKFLETRNVFE